MSTESDELKDIMTQMQDNIIHAMKLKSVMKRKGLREARCKCNRCGNDTLHGRLVGKKDHGRFWCTTEGCAFTQMME